MGKKAKKKDFGLAPLPKKVRIGSIDYDVELVNSKRIRDGNVMGIAIAMECLIQVSVDMSQQRQIETFVHEMLHMILYESGLENDKDNVHKELNPLCITITRMLQENDLGWIYREHQKSLAQG